MLEHIIKQTEDVIKLPLHGGLEYYSTKGLTFAGTKFATNLKKNIQTHSKFTRACIHLDKGKLVLHRQDATKVVLDISVTVTGRS